MIKTIHEFVEHEDINHAVGMGYGFDINKHTLHKCLGAANYWKQEAGTYMEEVVALEAAIEGLNE